MRVCLPRLRLWRDLPAVRVQLLSGGRHAVVADDRGDRLRNDRPREPLTRAAGAQGQRRLASQRVTTSVKRSGSSTKG